MSHVRPAALLHRSSHGVHYPGPGAIISSIGRWTSTGRCWRCPRPKGSFTQDHGSRGLFTRLYPPSPSPNRAAGTRTCTLTLFLPVLFYSGTMQGALLIEGAKVDEYENVVHLNT